MRQWYTVYTKPKREKIAEENLKRQGYEVYCPRVQLDRNQRGRWRKVIEPLFPRYLFVQLEKGKDNFNPIRSTIGVSDFVRFGGIPKAVSHALIIAIKAREDYECGLHIMRSPWQPGMDVEVTEGPFAGLRGIFLAKCAEERVIILLRLLGRDNKVVITQAEIAVV